MERSRQSRPEDRGELAPPQPGGLRHFDFVLLIVGNHELALRRDRQHGHDDVHKTYQVGDISVHALRGVSLRIGRGEYVDLPKTHSPTNTPRDPRNHSARHERPDRRVRQQRDHHQHLDDDRLGKHEHQPHRVRQVHAGARCDDSAARRRQRDPNDPFRPTPDRRQRLWHRQLDPPGRVQGVRRDRTTRQQRLTIARFTVTSQLHSPTREGPQ